MMRLKLVLIALVVLTCAQCSEQGKSSKVSISIIPKRPIVINADFTFENADGDDVEVIAPWFSFGYTVKNGSDETVTLVNMKIIITGIGKNGDLIIKETDLDPGDLNLMVLASVGPGQTTTPAQTWYVGDGPGEDKVNSFIYRVKIVAYGWFGSASTPTSSFKREVYVTTQY